LKGKILIAEDHDTISETYKLILDAQGYEVTVTGDGDECIRKFDECVRTSPQRPEGPYDLVLLDYHLPGKDGIDIAKHILSVSPSQRILFASSYPVDVIRKSAAGLPNAVELLVKPFDLNDLTNIVTGQKAPETVGFGHTEVAESQESEKMLPAIQVGAISASIMNPISESMMDQPQIDLSSENKIDTIEVESHARTNSTVQDNHPLIDLDDMPAPCCRVDDTAHISSCNEMLANLVGSTKDELHQTSLLELVDSSSILHIERILASLGSKNAQSSSIDSGNIMLKRKDCSITFPAALHIKPIQNSFGRTVSCNIIVMDQTLAHMKIEQAQKDKDELVRKEKLKDEFVAVASHELRTPIQPILGFALLAKKKLMPEEKAWDGVLREARKLQQLTNDILDASKIESGNMNFSMRKEKINLLLDSLADSVRGDMGKNTSLSVSYDEADLGLEVELDRSRISQVISNLLSNSIKFTEKGSITIKSRSFPAENKVEITVTDTGKGISEEILPFLFEKFATKGHGDVQNNKGTGLGLYISKAIIKGHRGEISAFNNKDVGATFLITLPISQTQQDATDADALNVRGMNLVSMQQVKAALPYFEQAVKLNPNHSKAWYNKGMCLMSLDESKDEALHCFQKAIEINPMDAEAWHNKGAILTLLERYSEALMCYDRALELKPGYAKAWHNKGHLLFRMGNKRGAKECLKNAADAGLR
jgi:signal transduction histidine kinase/FixJ family two-component response regulator